jgi:hypothetical protein
MSVLITCAYRPEWCNFAALRLEDLGVLPSKDVKRLEVSANSLTSKMMSAYKVSSERSTKFRQIKPGKAWQIGASDLFIENADQDKWGWSHSGNLFFLDFWKKFDDTTIFLLIYAPPEFLFGNTLDQLSQESILNDNLIKRWEEYNKEMLRFYHANKDISTLIHINQLEGTASKFSEHMNKKFELDLRRLNSSTELEIDYVNVALAKELLKETKQSYSQILAELEASVDLVDNMGQEQGSKTLEAFGSYNKLKQENIKITKEIRDHQQEYADIKEELLNLTKAEKSLKQENIKITKEIRDHQQEYTAIKVKLSNLKKAEKELKVDNGLLVAQLDQVQEELEFYFDKFQDTETNESPETKKTEKTKKGLTSVSLDFRNFINGKGWYNSEEFGRWGGELNEHSVLIPDIEPGKYALIIKIVDSMDLSIVTNLGINMDGESVDFKLKLHSNFKGLLGSVRRYRLKRRNIEKPFPAIIHSKILIKELDSENQSHQLTFSPPFLKKPSGKGGATDERNLSFCIESLTLRRL